MAYNVTTQTWDPDYKPTDSAFGERNNKLRGEFWHTCIRDGHSYPESQMQNINGQWIASKNVDPEDSE